jgi:4,5-DOPA dioxygenase extradiol
MNSKYRFPALFISHGSPMVALADSDDAYVHALHSYFAKLPARPKAVVVVSAHGLSPEGLVEITASSRPELIYDFGGFPKPLYEIEYPCPGSPELAVRIASKLTESGFTATLAQSSGLDHGVWVPARIAYPDADVPVIQVSMPYPTQPEKVLKLGRALAQLREEGVLLIGSGGLVHNLGKLVWHQKDGPAAPWAQEFELWVAARLAEKDVMGLCDFADAAPQANLAHPTPEHFYPIFFAVGASLAGDELDWIFRGVQYSSLSMSCFKLSSKGA